MSNDLKSEGHEHVSNNHAHSEKNEPRSMIDSVASTGEPWWGRGINGGDERRFLEGPDTRTAEFFAPFGSFASTSGDSASCTLLGLASQSLVRHVSRGDVGVRDVARDGQENRGPGTDDDDGRRAGRDGGANRARRKPADVP